tara:strand:+ start:5290 stop:5952 length:663 start_codon:yes stop_codon:yes gene_type:complete
MKVLITGGSSGLGKSILEIISLSHEVYFTYNNSIKSANEITDKFKNSFSYKCDFTNEIELKDFLNKVKNIDFDVLINNYYSGNFLGKHFSNTDSSDFLDVYKNNIIPVIDITQVLLKTFKKKKKGLIISISSESISNPPIGSGLYSTVKSVIEQLSKIWNSENKKFGIISKIISPSFMRTNLTSEIDERIIEMYFENISNRDEIKNISSEIMKIINNHKV